MDLKTRDTFTRPLADVAIRGWPRTRSRPSPRPTPSRTQVGRTTRVPRRIRHRRARRLRHLLHASRPRRGRRHRLGASAIAPQLADHIRFHEAPEDAPPDFFTICGGVLIENGDELWSCLGHELPGRLRRPERLPVDRNHAGLHQEHPPLRPRRDAVPTHTAGLPRRDRRRHRRGLAGATSTCSPQRRPRRRRRRRPRPASSRLEEGIWTAPIVIDPRGEPCRCEIPTTPGTLLQGFNAYESGRRSPSGRSSRRENWFADLRRTRLPGARRGHAGRELQPSPIRTKHSPSGTPPTPIRGASTSPAPPTRWSTDENGNVVVQRHRRPSPSRSIDQSRRHQIDLDAITEPTSVAYLYGGIIANGPGIVTFPDTFASNQLFEVVLHPGSRAAPADLERRRRGGFAADLASPAPRLGTRSAGCNARGPQRRRRREQCGSRAG